MAESTINKGWTETHMAEELLRGLLSLRQWEQYKIIRHRVATESSSTRPETVAKHNEELKGVLNFSPDAILAHNTYAESFNSKTKNSSKLPIFETIVEGGDGEMKESVNGSERSVEAGVDIRKRAELQASNNRNGDGATVCSEKSQIRDSARENREPGAKATAATSLSTPDIVPHAGHSDSKPAATDKTFIITNPERFELNRIRNLRQSSPNCVVSRIRVEVAHSDVKRVIMKLQNGPVDEVHIFDKRIFDRLGLGADMENFDEIMWIAADNASQPSYDLSLVTKVATSSQGRTRGILNIPRHAYLHWLDLRKERYPHNQPTQGEAKILAEQLNFLRWEDLLKELRDYWILEMGVLGKGYKATRMKWLGEDPTY